MAIRIIKRADRRPIDIAPIVPAANENPVSAHTLTRDEQLSLIRALARHHARIDHLTAQQGASH